MTLGRVGVGVGQLRANLFQAEAVLAHLVGVQLDAHPGQRAAAHRHLSNARNLRQLLRHDGGRRVVHLALVEHVRSKRDHEDRRIGGVHLAIGRIARQVCRKIAARGVDRRLHVARRGVDVAIEIELQSDAGGSQTARRSHLGNGCDSSELALEGRGDRRRHRLRGCARQAGVDVDRREIDLRKRRNGKYVERHGAGQSNGRGEQRGRDRTPDERFADVHKASLPPGCSCSKGFVGQAFRPAAGLPPGALALDQ